MCAEQGWPETCGSPRQSNNWKPFKPTFFEHFQLRTGLASLFLGHESKLMIIFEEILLRVET
jgi:hypothetical protein